MSAIFRTPFLEAVLRGSNQSSHRGQFLGSSAWRAVLCDLAVGAATVTKIGASFGSRNWVQQTRPVNNLWQTKSRPVCRHNRYRHRDNTGKHAARCGAGRVLRCQRGGACGAVRCGALCAANSWIHRMIGKLIYTKFKATRFHIFSHDDQCKFHLSHTSRATRCEFFTYDIQCQVRASHRAKET